MKFRVGRCLPTTLQNGPRAFIPNPPAQIIKHFFLVSKLAKYLLKLNLFF